MPQFTPNLNLELFDLVNDRLELFKDFRDAIAGTNSSNFQLIDTAVTDNANAITAIKGAGYTNETIVDNANAIESLANKGVYTAIASGSNSLTATVSELTSVDNNVVLKLIPSAKNTTTVTLNVNGDGVLPIVKVRNVSGSTVYTALDAGDLQPNSPVFITKSSDGIRYLLVNFGEIYTRNTFYEEDDSTFTDMQTKTTEINNKIQNSFSADANRYAGNQKLADDGQDVSLYISLGGILSQDKINVKIGSGSIKVEENDNISSTIAAFKGSLNLDFTKLDNGEVSTDDDYVYLVCYVTDISKFATARIYFDQSPTVDLTNSKQYNFESLLVNGWNYLKLKKSNFVTNGSGSWTGIQGIYLRYNTEANASGEYVSTQLIQLVKADPEDPSKPNYFQLNGEVEADVLDNAEFFVGQNNGKNEIVMLKSVDSGSPTPALKFRNTYDNFIANSTIKLKTGFSTFQELALMHKTNNDRIQVRYAGSPSDTLELVIVDNGVTTTTSSDLVPFDSGDTFDVKIKKNGSDVNVTVVKNKEYNKLYYIKGTSTSTGLSQAFNAINSRSFDIITASVGEIPHAYHSSVSDVAKSLEEQAFVAIYNNIVQSIPNAALTPIEFNTIRRDNRSHFNLNTPDQIEIRESGWYTLSASASTVSNASGYRHIIISKNSTAICMDRRDANSTSATVMNISTTYFFEAGDIIQVEVFQNSGGALDIQSVAAYTPEFRMHKIN